MKSTVNKAWGVDMLTIAVLDGFIKNNEKIPKDVILAKPQRDSLIKLQRSVWECTKDIGDKQLIAKRREFNKSCDRLIYRKKKKI